jgi:hypothetical protein
MSQRKKKNVEEEETYRSMKSRERNVEDEKEKWLRQERGMSKLRKRKDENKDEIC